MITIYGVYRSRASRPLWLLGEIGMEFRHVPVIQGYRLADPAAADAPMNTTTAAFRAVNPQGQIPAMTDDDLTLTESLAICQHIARKYGGRLAPQTLNEQAETDQWALFAATGIEGPALEILYTAPGTPEADAKIAACVEALQRPMARLDAHLATRATLIGDRFTVADLMVAECLRYGQGHAGLMASFPHARDWLERCQARPAFQAMWQARLGEPA